MPARYHIVLPAAQRVTLEEARAHHPKPYVRERAAALLKVAEGASLRSVAATGLLQVRRRETVKAWVVRYLAQGIVGLLVDPGRGRKPVFFPQHATAADAQVEVQHVVGRAPQTCDQPGTRWMLHTVAAACPWLRGRTPGVVHRVLDRLHITWQRARSYVHSPDRHYQAKLDDLAHVRQAIAAAPAHLALLYLDEVTIARQPTLAAAYAPRGGDAPYARRSWAADTETRVTATLDARTGRVVFQRGRVTLASLVRFYQTVRANYPHVERIFVVLDNWPVHYHPDVLVALEPQLTRWPFPRPGNWPATPSRRAVTRTHGVRLPIQLVPLPTYASWGNPIEKLWRKLRQEVTHLHPWADDLPGLRDAIDRFLTQFVQGSPDLLRYVGLCPG